MPLIFQKVYKRDDARRNPDVLYVFGDNVRRVGLGGQAAELRHEENAVGVATKYSPNECFGEAPAQIIAQNRIIDEDMKPLFEALKNGRVVVWPSDGIGTGLARLPQVAPSTFDHVEQKLAALIRVAKLFDMGDKKGAADEAAEHFDWFDGITKKATVHGSKTFRLPPAPKRPELDRLVEQSKEAAKNMSKEECEAMIAAQRASWARQAKD